MAYDDLETGSPDSDGTVPPTRTYVSVEAASAPTNVGADPDSWPVGPTDGPTVERSRDDGLFGRLRSRLGGLRLLPRRSPVGPAAHPGV